MFVTNWISTTKIQKISEITNFFRHYFLSRTEVRNKQIFFVESNLEIYFSNGCFYYLSDKDSEHEPQIGWRPGWEEKYKNNG